MLRKKFKIILLTLVVMSIPICANAQQREMQRAIIGDSVIIDKGESNGVIPPKDVLDDLNNNPGEEKQSKGTLKIRLSDTKKNSSKEGVKFSISKIADIENGIYKVKDSYSKVDVDLNNIKTASDLELAAELFKKVIAKDNTMITNSKGECSIDELDVGVYLISAEDIAKYDNITPFIVSLPHWNENDGMVYNLEVIPKHTEIIKKEKSKVPPTGFDDRSLVNLIIGSVCLVGSVALFLGVRKKESK